MDIQRFIQIILENYRSLLDKLSGFVKTDEPQEGYDIYGNKLTKLQRFVMKASSMVTGVGDSDEE